MKEEWKDVVGFEGLYKISNYGKVYSVRSNKLLSQGMTPKGYKMCVLCDNTKRHTTTIHKLVAEAFIPNPYSKSEINHIDEDKTNNCVDNLEWVTHEENMRHGTAAKRTAEKNSKGKVLCIETGETFDSMSIAARQKNLHQQNIHRSIITNNTTGGFHWTFM